MRSRIPWISCPVVNETTAGTGDRTSESCHGVDCDEGRDSGAVSDTSAGYTSLDVVVSSRCVSGVSHVDVTGVVLPLSSFTEYDGDG